MPPRGVSGDSASTGLAAESLVGPYRLIRELGQGGMAVVWLAERADGVVKRPVALKLPLLWKAQTGVVERFARERDVLAQLAHENIARLYDAGVASGRPYLALEYVDGNPITNYCDRNVLSIRPRLNLFLDVLNAVQYAHNNLVVHRDLKPANILVTHDGRVRLLDFGIAKLLVEGETEESELTRFAGRVLTPDYASPEQMAGVAITTRSDIYSLGIVLYELLTGERPYAIKRRTAGDAAATTSLLRPSQRTRSEEEARARGSTRKHLAAMLRGDLDAIVLKALERLPQDRYVTADAFARDIERYLAGRAVLAQPESSWKRARRFIRRNRLAVASAAAVIGLLGVGLGIARWEIHVAVVEKSRAGRQAAITRAVTDFLQHDVLAPAGPRDTEAGDAAGGADLSVRTALDRAAARIGGKFDKQPLVEASIRKTMGEAYRDLGLYTEAQHQVEQDIALRSRTLGRMHRETLSSRYRLAELYSYEGRFAEAEALQSEVLDAQQRTLGEQDPDTIYTLAALADSKSDLRKLDRAEVLFKKALRLSTQVLGEGHTETITIMNDLGVLYQRERKYPDAFSIMTKALDVQRRAFGDQHPITLTISYNLGTISMYYGKYVEALPLLVRAEEERRRTLGEDHPDALVSKGILGTFDLYVGKYEQAAGIFVDVLNTERRVLGAQHPVTNGTALTLAQVYANLGKYQDAEQLLHGVIANQQRTMGPEHPRVLSAATSLAYVYAREGKSERAEQIYKTSLATELRVLGENHSETLDTMNQLGQLYQRRGDYGAAEPLLNRAIEVRKLIAAPENVFLADTRRALGQMRLDQRRYPEAESLLRSALAAYERAGSESWLRYQTEVLLGSSLAAMGKNEEAKSLLSSGYRGIVLRRTTVPGYARPLVKMAEEK